MSKRLQVIFDDSEYREIQKVARRRRMTVAAWVRDALRSVRNSEPVRDTRKKLDAVRKATLHDFPTSDIDQMLAEIEAGYWSDGPR